MRVNEFANKVRERKPEYAHLDDTDLIQMVAQKKPDLLANMDRADMAQIMRESRKKKITRARKKEFSALSGFSRFGLGEGEGMLNAWRGIKSAFQTGDKGHFQDNITRLEEMKLDADEEDLPQLDRLIEKQKARVSGISRSLEQMKTKKAGFQGMTEGDFATGAGEFVGGTVPYLATPVSGIAMGTATGGAIGALSGTDEEERSTDALLGSLFGAGGALVGKLGSRVVNALKKRYASASVQELEDLAESYGVKLSKGDVTGKAGTRKAEVNMESKTGGLSSFRESQSKDVDKVLNKVGRQFKTDKSFSKIGSSMKESAKKVQKQAKEKATKYYDKVEAGSGKATVEPKNTVNAIDEMLEQSGKSKTTKKNPATEYLEGLKMNLLDDKPNYSQLRATREALGKDAKDFMTSNPSAGGALKQVRKAVEKDMDEVIKQIPGGKQLKRDYEIAKKHYREEVIPFKESNTLKALLKEEHPDRVFRKLIKDGEGDQARKLYRHMDAEGKEAIESGIVKTALEKAKVDTEFGEVYSPVNFANQIKKLDEQTKIFMTPAKQKYLEGVKRLMRASKRAGQYMENPPTGQRLLLAQDGFKAKASLGIAPLITQFEKFFSTGKGKNLILAASELDPNSGEMTKLLKTIFDRLPQTATKLAQGVE